MIRVTTIFTRPNVDIPYYMDTNPELKLKKEVFVMTCGLVSKFKKDESDPLVQKVIADYQSKEVLNQFLKLWNEKFPTAIRDRDEYNIRNNIKYERFEEIID